MSTKIIAHFRQQSLQSSNELEKSQKGLLKDAYEKKTSAEFIEKLLEESKK